MLFHWLQMSFAVETVAKGNRWLCSANDRNESPSILPCLDARRRSMQNVQLMVRPTQVFSNSVFHITKTFYFACVISPISAITINSVFIAASVFKAIPQLFK